MVKRPARHFDDGRSGGCVTESRAIGGIRQAGFRTRFARDQMRNTHIGADLMTEKRKQANEATVKRLSYAMCYAQRYRRFLETALWPDPNENWVEPEQETL